MSEIRHCQPIPLFFKIVWLSRFLIWVSKVAKEASKTLGESGQCGFGEEDGPLAAFVNQGQAAIISLNSFARLADLYVIRLGVPLTSIGRVYGIIHANVSVERVSSE